MSTSPIQVDDEGNVRLSELPKQENFPDYDYDEFFEVFKMGLSDRQEEIKDTKYDYLSELWQNYQKLTGKQQKALPLILTGENMRDIAKKCEIHEATLYRWFQIDLFNQVLERWRKEIFKSNQIKLNKLADKAIDRLADIFDNPKGYDDRTLDNALSLVMRANGMVN